MSYSSFFVLNVLLCKYTHDRNIAYENEKNQKKSFFSMISYFSVPTDHEYFRTFANAKCTL